MGTHWIKKPGKTPGNRGQSWQILHREGKGAELPKGRKTPKSSSVELPALEALNVAWHAGTLSYEEAEKSCRELLKQLRAPKNRLRVFHSENQGVLDQYWEAEYAQRILVDAEGMRRSLIAAINVIGHLSLRVATRNELQAAINNACPKATKQRKICSRINQLLAFLKRDFSMTLAKPDSPEVKYITEPELLKLLAQIDIEHRPLIATLFYTGMRLGESFAFKIKKPGVIRVEKQLDRKGNLRAVKNRRPRTVAVSDAGWPYVLECYELMQQGKYPRSRDYRSITKKAARKLWKDNRQKHLVVHDLRHSFAIHMLHKGCSISEIALLLGDSVAVAQQYYVGFVANDETIDMIRTKLQAS